MRTKGKQRRGVGRSGSHQSTALGHPWARACEAALRARRRSLGLTQAELADLAGVGLAFLCELEQGKATLRLDKLVDVAQVLELELQLTDGKQGLRVDPRLASERAS